MSQDKEPPEEGTPPDCFDWTPEQALAFALEKERKTPCSRILIIRLDDEDGRYSINTIRSGLKTSETVALCEAVKHVYVKDMFPPDA